MIALTPVESWGMVGGAIVFWLVFDSLVGSLIGHILKDN